MKKAITKEVIWSAVFGGIGLAFLYQAAFGFDRNVLHLVLWHAGCGFGFISISTQPQLLFARVDVLSGLRLQGAGRHGVASYLNFLSTFCMAFAAITWLAT